MATTSMLKARGLHTYNSYLSEIPEGALSVAENVNIDRVSVVESRRGIKQYGTIGSVNSDVAKQLLLYKDRVLAHYGDSISFDNGSGIFTDFLASFEETEAGLRIKSIEQNGNLYLTTSTGIRKISTNSAANLGTAKISDAGGIKAVGGIAVANYSTEGFFEGYSKVAYKIVWGTKDINNNLILGTPSMPIEVINQSPNSATVDITFDVPPSVTTDYFYRIYRTDLFTAATFNDIQNLVVNDEYRLVYEAAYVSGTQITINDIVPEDFRQGNVTLYTNENSGEGILQANEPPPFAKDIAIYKNSAFFANTRTRYKLLVDLIGTSNFKRYNAVGDTITITSIIYSAPNTDITFSADPGLVIGNKIVVTNSGSALDGIRTITNVTGNTITVVGNSTGATAATTSVYGSYITITKASNVDNYFFVGRPEINDVSFPAYYAGIDQDYFILYSTDDETGYVVYFHDTAGPVVEPSNSETEGKILIKVDVDATDTTGSLIAEKVQTAIEANSYDFVISRNTNTLTISTANSGSSTNPDITTINPVTGISTTNNQNGDGENASLGYIRLSSLASPSQRIDDTARSLARVITSNVSGDVNVYYISGPNDVPGKFSFESRLLDTTSFNVVGSDTDVGAEFNEDISSPGLDAENEEKPNRLYYSKTSQPEAVPLVNYVDIGPQDKKILRILGLRDSLFIIKEEGVYRLTGENPTNFFVTLFDNSTNVIASDTCSIMNNNIFCLTTQGIARISETGIDIISQPVQDAFNTYTSPRYLYFKTASFACSYIQDYAYIIWLPANPTDTTGTIAYRFSTKTETWTTWTKTGNAMSAIVNPASNKLYIGPDDDNIVEIERKDLRRIDFADREYELSISADSVVGTTIQLSSVANITIGDALKQQQYVTASVIERLSKKFALDAGVPNTVGNDNKDFYRNYTINPGDSLQDALAEIITQLNSDIGTAFSTLYSTNIVTFQTQYNALVSSLNLNATLLHTNYLPATALIEFELFINAIDKGENTVTVDLMQPIATGPITHYKAIDCVVVCSPYFFGEPELLKHVRDAKLIFASATITRATVGYNTDLSTNFEDVPFTMEGVGNWGTWIYNSVSWGGEGTARPFRTLIPRKKQRCRFIRTRLKHKAAFDEFRLLGISYSFEANSEKAYR